MVDLENGYTRIANELLEAIIRSDLSKRQVKVLLAVIRKTYGYGRKFDRMTLTQLQDLTGMDMGNLSRTVAELVDAKVLLKQQGSDGANLGVSKTYRNWKLLSKRQGVVKTTNPGLSKRQGQKKYINKQPPCSPPNRRTRKAPPDFEVTDDMRTWAAEKVPAVDVDFETAKFRDHEFATAKSDWKATWRNWLRNAKGYGNAKTQRQTQHDGRTPWERWEEKLASGELD